MTRRALLACLLVVATAAFVVGVSIERSSADSHSESASTAAEASGEAHTEQGERGGEAHAETPATHSQEKKNETLLGIDYEAVPFLVLAAAFSLALAAAVWRLPASRSLLALLVVAMVAFGALDVREVMHQLDESNGGLAVLAAAVAGLHLAVATLALTMARAGSSVSGDSLA
jgi:hypothetical protein